MTSSQQQSNLPLVVDLDGTLLQGDLLAESALALLKRSLLDFLKMPLWLLSGKSVLKAEIAKRVELDISSLPFNQELLGRLRAEKAAGRPLVLATASHQKFAQQIQEHLQIFDTVLATDSDRNLSATAKRDALVAQFGDKGFDYAGNSRDDLPVWQACRHAWVVNPEAGVESAALQIGNVTEVVNTRPAPLTTWIKALRMHQWMKNLLIFVPLLASHQIAQPGQLVRGVIAFVAFGLCASSVYLLNDLLDVTDDRHHHSKKKRPFASGSLSLLAGAAAFPILLAGAFALALWLLPWQFAAALAAYYALTLVYSLGLKRLVMVDVITLAILYTQRIIAGTFAFAVSMTFWMLAFSMFIFLSLALVKRYAELRDARQSGKTGKARGRGYFPDDLEMIASLGAASGYLSILVLALYIQDKATSAMYQKPEVIWLACPLLLFWVSRTWVLTHRGQMHDDPVVFAIKDRTSIIVGLMFGAIFWLAK